MPHDPRITIRLLPRQLRALRAIVQVFADHPTTAALIGLSAVEITLAKDSLMHLPVLAPQNTYTDHHAELTPEGWTVRAEKAAQP